MRQDEELGNGKLSVRGMEPTREHMEVLRETRQKGRPNRREKKRHLEFPVEERGTKNY